MSKRENTTVTISLNFDSNFGEEVKIKAVDGDNKPITDEHILINIAHGLQHLSEKGKLSETQKNFARFFWMPLFLAQHMKEVDKIQDEVLNQMSVPMGLALKAAVEGAPTKRPHTERRGRRL